MKKMAVSALAALTLLLSSALPAMAAKQSIDGTLGPNEKKQIAFVADDRIVSLYVNYQYSSSRTNVDYRLYDGYGKRVDEENGQVEIDGDVTDSEVKFRWRNLTPGHAYYLEIDNDSRDSSEQIEAEIRGELVI